ncbi:UPF0146 family protein [Halorarum salinum]|uniref:UPF0146 protein HUG12_19300 n=1 Tax=Halorarum salinum TaxID=2743089 RepID=A0A7D5LD64_9EURY|nr:UPF0146 family protein [Halobaculum salinum]QLG63754.1 hypothetical protein HUG12_19300 [Halobaculum salinum]
MRGPAISFPPVSASRPRAVVRFLARYASLCEVGVGRRPDVAAALADRGRPVTATDVHDRELPAGVRFVRDDVVEASERPDPGDHYRADAVYARNLPPELHRPVLTVARRVDADCLFTTLGGDQAAVDARPVALEDGTTVHVARERNYRRERDDEPKRGSDPERGGDSEREIDPG